MVYHSDSTGANYDFVWMFDVRFVVNNARAQQWSWQSFITGSLELAASRRDSMAEVFVNILYLLFLWIIAMCVLWYEYAVSHIVCVYNPTTTTCNPSRIHPIQCIWTTHCNKKRHTGLPHIITSSYAFWARAASWSVALRLPQKRHSCLYRLIRWDIC